MRIGIFYGSTSGSSEAIAEELEFYLKKEELSSFNVASGVENIKDFKNLIFVAPTYGVGELQKDWETCQRDLKLIDFTDKTVALVGLGNQFAFGESYIGAIKILYDIVTENHGKIIGFTDTKGYLFKESEALVDDKFVGLALDEVNQSNMTPDRIEKWLEEIKKEFN